MYRHRSYPISGSGYEEIWRSKDNINFIAYTYCYIAIYCLGSSHANATHIRWHTIGTYKGFRKWNRRIDLLMPFCLKISIEFFFEIISPFLYLFWGYLWGTLWSSARLVLQGDSVSYTNYAHFFPKTFYKPGIKTKITSAQRILVKYFFYICRF